MKSFYFALALVVVPFAAYAQSSLVFSRSSITMTKGETTTVAVSGTGNLHLSGVSDPTIISASFNSPVLTITALMPGSAYANVCYTIADVTSCGKVEVLVNTAAQTTTTETITFSKKELELRPGQAETVTVSGSGAGSFYLGTNSAPNIVTPNLSGNSVTIFGVNQGGANISVCQFGGACGNIYAFVSGLSSTGATSSLISPVPTNNAIPTAIAAFGISSSNMEGTFAGRGSVLTITFSTTRALVSKSVTIFGQNVPVVGTGAGPFTATYTVVGTEPKPLAIKINYADSPSSHKEITFTIGEGAQVVASTPSSTSSQAQVTEPVFLRPLGFGSTGDDVLALQRILGKKGFLTATPNGYFGMQTASAVKAYQTKNGLEPLGTVGPGTRALLNKGE